MISVRQQVCVGAGTNTPCPYRVRATSERQLTTVLPAPISSSFFSSDLHLFAPDFLAATRRPSYPPAVARQRPSRIALHVIWDICPQSRPSPSKEPTCLVTVCHVNYIDGSVSHSQLRQGALQCWLRCRFEHCRSRLGHPLVFDYRCSHIFGSPAACFCSLTLPPQQNLVGCLSFAYHAIALTDYLSL